MSLRLGVIAAVVVGLGLGASAARASTVDVSATLDALAGFFGTGGYQSALIPITPVTINQGDTVNVDLSLIDDQMLQVTDPSDVLLALFPAPNVVFDYSGTVTLDGGGTSASLPMIGSSSSSGSILNIIRHLASTTYDVQSVVFSFVMNQLSAPVEIDNFKLAFQGVAGQPFAATVATVPLPAGLPLMGGALALLGGLAWWRRKATARRLQSA